VDQKELDSNTVYPQGQADMQYLQATWFTQPEYLKYADRPVLFNFGSQYFINAIDWETLFTGLEARPALVTLDKHWVSASVATFPWPPMSQSGDGVLSQADLENYLDGFYKKLENYKYRVGGAFPDFMIFTHRRAYSLATAFWTPRKARPSSSPCRKPCSKTWT